MNLHLSNYARIGKSPMIKAIGLQKNHKEIIYTETKKLDCEASGCFSCVNHTQLELGDIFDKEAQLKALDHCKNCPNAKYTTVYDEKTIYVNEKNKFGYQPRLKQIALKLLLLYHFAEPDDNGLVRGLEPKKLAALLQCSVRSIKNANITLMKYGYILYNPDAFSKNRFQVILPEYSSYHLPAEQGGRGYATFNKECLLELIKIKDLNQLRIFLRLSLDADGNRNIEKDVTIKRDISNLRLFLPRYCKPGVIKKALNTLNEIFDINIDDYAVNLKMNAVYHGRRSFEQGNIINTQLMDDYIHRIDTTIDRANDCINKEKPISSNDISFLQEAGIYSKRYIGGNINKSFYSTFGYVACSLDTKDLGVLCTTYGVEPVKKAISYIYEHYIVNCDIISSFGALVRTLIRENIYNHQNSSLFANS